jgi:hypothetical protein
MDWMDIPFSQRSVAYNILQIEKYFVQLMNNTVIVLITNEVKVNLPVSLY